MYEARSRSGQQQRRALYQELANLYRGVERRHRISAGLHEAHAQRMERWLVSGGTGTGTPPPAFLAAVAAALGTSWMAAVVRGQDSSAAVPAVSAETALAACDLESILAEGPMRASEAEHATVAVAGPLLTDRWPRYGPAAADLGVRSVVAVPLAWPGGRLGTMCAYGEEDMLRRGFADAVAEVAGVLGVMMAQAARADGGMDPLLILRFGGHEQDWLDAQQAAGMVSVRCQCTVAEAADLIAARAFAESRPMHEIAAGVLRGEIRLD